MRKIFKYSIEIDGIDQFLIQDVKKPKKTIGKTMHASDNHDIKEAGGIEFSDAELKKVKPSDQGDSWAWDWMNDAQNADTGLGKLEAGYKKNIVFKELNPMGSVMNAWLWEGAWILEADDSEYKKGNKSENVIESVKISVDNVKKII